MQHEPRDFGTTLEVPTLSRSQTRDWAIDLEDSEGLLAADREGLRSQVTLLASERDIALNLAEEQEQRANALFAQRESALADACA